MAAIPRKHYSTDFARPPNQLSREEDPTGFVFLGLGFNHGLPESCYEELRGLGTLLVTC